LCIHDKISRLSGAKQTAECKKAVKNCKCVHYNNLQDKIGTAEFQYHANQIYDIEDLVSEVGRKHSACPYYYSSQQLADSEMVFMPYTYLVEKRHRDSLLQGMSRLGVRGETAVNLLGSILIFDEAHNLESACIDATSFDITSADLQSCIQETQKAIDLSSAIDQERVEEYRLLKTMFLELEQQLDDLGKEEKLFDSKSVSKPGSFIFSLFDKIRLNASSFELFLACIDSVTELLTYHAGDAFIELSSLEKFKTAVQNWPSPAAAI
jgi:Rad3-related DNA helicase